MVKKLISLAVFSALSFTMLAWVPVGDKIKTRWASEVDPSNPLPEYPRPQMVRSEWMNLNGLWEYSITSADTLLKSGEIAPQGEILVPFPLESSLSGVGRSLEADQALWYRRTFRVPSSWKGREVKLNFGAVDWSAEVWVNDVKVGSHKGGYAPFSFNVTSALKKSGNQTLVVKVLDASDMSWQPRGKQCRYPRAIWYTPVSGIWQTVWMEPVGKARVESFQSVADLEKGRLHFTVNTTGLTEKEALKVELFQAAEGYDPEKPSTGLVSATVFSGDTCSIAVPDAKLWTPDTPYLYGVRVSVLNGKKVLDSVNGYAAMRQISKMRYPAKHKNYNSYNRFMLNGRPIFSFGPLDQGWWPDGLYTAPTDEALKFDVVKTRDFGFNTIRKHIKVEPARWYYYCDVLGIMVWQDMPCIGDYSNSRGRNVRPAEIIEGQNNGWTRDSFLGGTDCKVPDEWKLNYYNEWSEIIESLKTFPSIIVWVPFNEAWGQFDTPEVVEFTRKADSTRLVNEASGGNYCLKGDILDAHHYACPDLRVFEGKMINVIGEYGGLGYLVKGHLWQDEDNWGYGQTLPSGEEVLKLYAEFAKVLEGFIDRGCSGAIYTQTTDVEVEVNGLMTYDREVVKVDENRLREINQAVIRHGLYSGGPCKEKKLLPEKDFVADVNGRRTDLYTIANGDVTMQVTNLGCRVVSIWTPDRKGNFADIATGYDNIGKYLSNTGERFLGATVGRVANRIGKGTFTLDGKTFQLPLNNNGNTLHGGLTGLDMEVWDLVEKTDSSLLFSLRSADGTDGWPGNLDIRLKYTLTPSNEFKIEYSATTDAPTLVNMSNHTFFNLTGDSSRSILDHELWINASRTTPVDELLIPTGEVVPLDGSPLDFREAKAIGRDINANCVQLDHGNGYDHNWCLDKKTDGVELAATLYEPESGRFMEVLTDQPGLQFYCGNFFTGGYTDKYGIPIGYRCSLAMETQKWPDSINHEGFSDTVLRPGETYTQTCIYRFSTK